jgi:hypothetical protein
MKPLSDPITSVAKPRPADDPKGAMDFVLGCVIFVVFGLGFVLAFRGIVGNELEVSPRRLSKPDPDNPGIKHPPERHRLRLILIGLMIAAILFGSARLPDPTSRSPTSTAVSDRMP